MTNHKIPESTFKLTSSYTPTGDQPQAIEKLVRGLENGIDERVLLGVTGSGKTFTIANVIERVQRPTLVISHNKTLAAQLYQEFRDFFPDNAVSFFVSYYDYYQPEAYVPHTDTYIEKETQINDEIDKLRLAATTNILTRPDTLIVASVSCIYNIGSPKEYGEFVLELRTGIKINRQQVMERLVALQYQRNDFEPVRGTFRVRGESIIIYPAYEDNAVRIVADNTGITHLERIDGMSGEILEQLPIYSVFPAKHYMTNPSTYKSVIEQIRSDLEKQVKLFTDNGKLLEAHRIKQRVEYDLEMLQEVGYVNGIENYSRYFDGRKPGDPPYSLFDFFEYATGNKKDEWLLVIDESHMTVPQIRGMYNGDRSRKSTLIDYGFRLPASLDNRPLRFDEFLRKIPQTIYVSATPDEWELSRAEDSSRSVANGFTGNGVVREKGTYDEENTLGELTPIVEQLIRPTGLIDPVIRVRPSSTQVADLLVEVEKRVARHERVLVTTLTKRMAEDLSKYMEEKNIKVNYLHSDIDTLKRTEILADLRSGSHDVIIGVNLLREGLDLPEVSLVAILDADKEGFLRSHTSLIQTMGRAARHVEGEVIAYADVMTKSLQKAIEEVERRRKVQLDYNEQHGITPTTIVKPIREGLVAKQDESPEMTPEESYTDERLDSMTPLDKSKAKNKLTAHMRQASKELRFEDAARIRDIISKLIE